MISEFNLFEKMLGFLFLRYLKKEKRDTENTALIIAIIEITIPLLIYILAIGYTIIRFTNLSLEPDKLLSFITLAATILLSYTLSRNFKCKKHKFTDSDYKSGKLLYWSNLGVSLIIFLLLLLFGGPLR